MSDAPPVPSRWNRRVLAALVAAASAVACAGPAAAAPGKGDAVRAPAKEESGTVSFGRTAAGATSLLVTFADRPDRAEAERRLADLGAVSSLVPEAGVWRLRPVDRDRVLVQALRRRNVLAAEWPLVRRSMERPRPADPLPVVAPASPFTDPLLLEQWMLNSNGWEPALTGRTPRPTIAILDSGIARDHPDWRGPESPLLPGWSSYPGQAARDADDWGINGHGSHVAGIAAAPANRVGIVGVAPGSADGAQVIPVQVADQFGEFSDEGLVQGIRYAVKRGARIINISAGGADEIKALQETVYWATQQGAVVVAAVGNDAETDNETKYPAAYRRVVGVGAQCGPDTTFDCPRRYGVARFSTYNATVDLVAPGVDILSTVPTRVTVDTLEPGYALKDGTSMASPYVAGAIALVQAANGNTLSPFQVVRQLERTATDLDRPGRDDRAGFGAVNLTAAVTSAAPPDDADEVNDDIRFLGKRSTNLSQSTARLRVEADIDRFDDPDDVYPVYVRAGERLRVELSHASGRLEVYLWGPGTRTVSTGEANQNRNLVGYVGKPGRRQVVVVRAKRSGRYYINVYARRGTTSYTLRARSQP